MSSKKIRVGFVGSARAIEPVVKLLSRIPEVVIAGVSGDETDTAQAMELKEVRRFTDVGSLVSEQPLDWLIHLSNEPIPQPTLAMQELEATTVVDGALAELLDTVASGVARELKANGSEQSTQEQRWTDFAWAIVQKAVSHAGLGSGDKRKGVIQDPLTGIISRHGFIEFLDREIGRAYREPQPVAVIMLEIDDFDSISAEFGQEAANKLLKELARLMSASQRYSDVVARYAREQFAALLVNTGLSSACVWAERLRRKVNRELSGPDGKAITISLGTSAFRPSSILNRDATAIGKIILHSRNALLDKADEALSQAKESDGNWVISLPAQVGVAE